MVASDTPHSSKRDQRDDRILDATETLIGELGFDRVRLIDIAEAAQVSIGSLQHRFRNRDNLLVEAVVRADERQRDEWIRLTHGVDEPWERLLALLTNVLDLDSGSLDQNGWWLQIIAASHRHPDLLRIMQGQQDMWTAAFTEVVADGMSSGRFTSDLSPEQAGLALLALTDGFYLSRKIGDAPPTLAEIATIVHIVAHNVITVVEPQ